ncbi:TetR family transcriptional regulator [Herbihabitans rhizosphaerae]|uniref:TetR family transcriptional regulator n=1 Tax=Herbihabitans rhizosphaerae TaxID=1872711 RepID=A0A4Q7KHB3_9PSEU|nr:TetR/AcrR family transcriptional regulator [Herbihabitans rhizosphaerae]RZS32637.1 TetR family transcriptional regulator [Herbihabitans rhizosphaerae]
MSAEAVPQRRRRLDPDARREQILACALKLFGERPYAAVSTADIAAEAGVARGLLNHYFGTKRELYLEVVTVLVRMPTAEEFVRPQGTLRHRIDVSVSWFLDMIAEHGGIWMRVIGAEGVGADPEVERIMDRADEVAADRVLDAVGLTDVTEHREELRAMLRSYGGLAKAACREWLTRENLGRDQVQLLLSQALYTIVKDVFPTVRE